MSVNSINNFGAAYGTSSASNGSSTGSTSNSSALTMDDFFKLLVAQLSNQDMYNTVDDNQFMAQMAQFSMVQALNDLSKASATAYGVSLIGKEVTLSKNNADGTLGGYKGIVEGVNMYNGSAEIVVDKVAYPLSSVMKVAEPKIIIPDPSLVTMSDTSTVSEPAPSTVSESAPSTASESAPSAASEPAPSTASEPVPSDGTDGGGGV